MNTFIRYKLILLASLFLTCCGEEQFSINYGDLSTYSAAGHLQMVVEIPAGTNVKLEYDIETNTFPVDKKNGKDEKKRSNGEEKACAGEQCDADGTLAASEIKIVRDKEEL